MHTGNSRLREYPVPQDGLGNDVNVVRDFITDSRCDTMRGIHALPWQGSHPRSQFVRIMIA